MSHSGDGRGDVKVGGGGDDRTLEGLFRPSSYTEIQFEVQASLRTLSQSMHILTSHLQPTEKVTVKV
jgi:hypothetical protein